jgi:hypothetical protein
MTTWNHKLFATEPDPCRQSDLANLCGPYGCPKKFNYMKLRGEVTEPDTRPVNWPRPMGTAIHEVIAFCLRQNLTGLSRDRFPDMILGELERELAGQPIDWQKTSQEAELASGSWQVHEALADIRTRARDLLLIEGEFLTKIGQFFFRGTIDLVFRDHAGRVVLLDWKTGGRPMHPVVRDHGYQLGIYAHALKHGTFRGATVGLYPDDLYIVQTQEMVPYVKASRRTVWDASEAADLGVEVGTQCSFQPGQRRGPAWYRSNRTEADTSKLLESVSIAIRGVRRGTFYENISDRCAGCDFKVECLHGGQVRMNSKLSAQVAGLTTDGLEGL